MANDGELLAPGKRLEEFEIEGLLGKGGFGVTYLARDLRLGRQVAVKEYLPQDWAARQPDGTVGPRTHLDAEDYQWGLKRFLTEAKTLAKFDHPHIMRVHRVLEARGTAYLVSEYVEGPDGGPRSLSDELKTAGTLSEERVRELLDVLTAGLEPVHAAGMVHRDIKPANIMLRPNGAPVLIDFGAARQTMGLHSKSTTLTQVLTPKYAPIEQYSTRGKQGPWTDIYSLGAVAYFALSGRLPDDATERVRRDTLAPLRLVAAQPLSVELATAVEAALATDEEDRPQSLHEWRALLEAPIERSVETGRARGDDEDRVSVRARPVWRYSAVAGIGMALAVLALVWPLGSPPAVVESGLPEREPSPRGESGSTAEETRREAPPADTPEASPRDESGSTAEEALPDAPPTDAAAEVSAEAEAGPAAEEVRPRAAPPDRVPRAEVPPRRDGSLPGPEVSQLLADAVAAETSGDLERALDLYGQVLSRNSDDPTAVAGQERVQARITQIIARERLREANTAFVAGRYADARRLFQDAYDLAGSPEAAQGLRRVDNVEALICTDEATCGTLVVQVRPAAEIVVDDRVLGTAARLELRVLAGRHRVRLETDELWFPWTLEVVARATEVLDVNLERQGYPK